MAGMAEALPAADDQRLAAEAADQAGQVEREKEDTNQAAELADPKSFVDRISSFFNQALLSDVTIEVKECSN